MFCIQNIMLGIIQIKIIFNNYIGNISIYASYNNSNNSNNNNIMGNNYSIPGSGRRTVNTAVHPSTLGSQLGADMEWFVNKRGFVGLTMILMLTGEGESGPCSLQVTFLTESSCSHLLTFICLPPASLENSSHFHIRLSF